MHFPDLRRWKMVPLGVHVANKIRNGVDPGQAGAWHHQHRMQRDNNMGLCSQKATNVWEQYNKAMTDKCGENWKADNPDIDAAIVHDIGGLRHGRFAMGDGVIGPSDADSVKARKRMRPNTQPSGASTTRTTLWQMELTPEWRGGVERVLQALAVKVGIDIDGLMSPESEVDTKAGTEWCNGVERVLQALANIIPIDIRALFSNIPSSAQQSTAGSDVGASHEPTCEGISREQVDGELRV